MIKPEQDSQVDSTKLFASRYPMDYKSLLEPSMERWQGRDGIRVADVQQVPRLNLLLVWKQKFCIDSDEEFFEMLRILWCFFTTSANKGTFIYRDA
jgi:hypothetical protein